MLIHFLRLVFIVLAVLIGLAAGHNVYRGVGWDIPVWFGGAMGFGIAITLIAVEQAFRRHFTRSLVAFLIGLAAGLMLSLLILLTLRQVIQNDGIYANLDLPITLVTTYLVLITVLRNADRFRVVVPFVEFRAETRDGGVLVVDADLLGDARLPALLKAGVVADRVLVHRRALARWEGLIASDDAVQRLRARRALDGLAALRALGKPAVDIDETEIPNASDLADVLIRLARLENGRIATADRDLANRAAALAVPVLDLALLSAALAPVVRPGEVITVTIDKAGEGRGQGVGHLDDGSLVVVGDAADRIGQPVRCTVMRMHHTNNGRMVFADRIAQ